MVYSGPVRSGFGGREERKVLRCNHCAIDRLDKFFDPMHYETGHYRTMLGEESWDYAFHDRRQKDLLNELPSLRDLTVVDVGCGRGSFLDLIAGQAGRLLGVEPNKHYHDIPYETYSYCAEVPEGIADIVVSFDVIEHTEDPVEFLTEMGEIVDHWGKIYIATPNSDEILLRLLPEFKEFRYQTVHNWYFTMQTLKMCAQKAGLVVTDLRTVHGYGIGNTLGWLIDRKPVGDRHYPFLPEMFDHMWVGCLNREGLGETIFMECRRRDS